MTRSACAERCCLKVADWPAEDRQQYELAVTGDPFGEMTVAAHWRPATRHKNERGYGRWLTFLHGQRYDLTITPAARVTTANVDAYISELREQRVKPYTLRNRCLELLAVMLSIAPGIDWSWLRSRANALNCRAAHASRGKARFLDTLVVVEACERALAQVRGPLPRKAIPAFRNWLILYFLAYVPIRLGNLASLELGRQLVSRNGEWLVTLEAEETKNGRAYSAPVPPELARYLNRYLADMRPALAKLSSGDSVWLGMGGEPLAAHSIHIALRELTQREFGIALGPHSLRHSFATFAAATVGIEGARAGMGHMSSRRTQGYNHATTLVASMGHAELIASLRAASNNERKRKP